MIALRIRTYRALPDRVLILETTAQNFQSVPADQPRGPVLLHEIQFKDTRGRLMFFGVGALSQALAIAALLAIPIFFPERFVPIRQHLVSSLEPAPAEYISPRVYHPIVAHRFRERLLAPEPTAARRVYLPVLRAPLTPRQARKELNYNPLDLVASSAGVPPSPIASTTIPILEKPPEPVQTGAFDSSLLSAESNVRSGADTRELSVATNQTPVIVPIEILYKPKPAYTQAARDKKIVGEVILQVLFSAGGTVHIQRIVQGLGSGLDDSAETAAREIRFRPAMKDGAPVDWTALVHAKFELAY